MSNLKFFACQKSILRHYHIQNIKDGTEIRVHKINKERVTHFSQFTSVIVNEILRKSQAHFREKLGLRLRHKRGFLIEKACSASGEQCTLDESNTRCLKYLHIWTKSFT